MVIQRGIFINVNNSCLSATDNILIIWLITQEGGIDMLKDNIKNFRKAKGLSQEELAIKLSVVRQTISKWEQGLSVPDASMLIQIADALGTNVNTLLGDTVEEPEEQETIGVLSAKLELLNEQYSKQNERRRKIWRAIFVVIGIAAGLSLIKYLLLFSTIFRFQNMMGTSSGDASVTVIGGADGPTSIFVSSYFSMFLPVIITILVAVGSVFGIYYTRKK